MTRGGGRVTREHRHDAPLAAGAALGDLSSRERARWAGLRDGCPVCRGLEHELDDVLAELALAVPAQVPPASVLDGIRSAIRAEADRPSS